MFTCLRVLYVWFILGADSLSDECSEMYMQIIVFSFFARRDVTTQLRNLKRDEALADSTHQPPHSSPLR